MVKQNGTICVTKKSMSINDTVRESLAIALLKLMEKEKLSQITVSDIVKVAGVGRSSFYRNYSSKEELLFDYIISLYREYFRERNVPLTMNDAMRTEDFLLPRFIFIEEHRKIFGLLHKSEMLYYFFNKIESDYILVLCGQDIETSPYYRSMFSGSCAGIIRQWIERDFAETPEEMVSLFKTLPGAHIVKK